MERTTRQLQRPHPGRSTFSNKTSRYTCEPHDGARTIHARAGKLNVRVREGTGTQLHRCMILSIFLPNHRGHASLTFLCQTRLPEGALRTFIKQKERKGKKTKHEKPSKQTANTRVRPRDFLGVKEMTTSFPRPPSLKVKRPQLVLLVYLDTHLWLCFVFPLGAFSDRWVGDGCSRFVFRLFTLGCRWRHLVKTMQIKTRVSGTLSGDEPG